MISENIKKETSRELQRFESIGKTGKVQKIFEVSVEHLRSFRRSSNDFSLKIIAYIIKGIFIIYKRHYENLYRDLQMFIETYISGKKKKIQTEKKSSIEKSEKPDSANIFSIRNILTSDTNFSNFLDDSHRMNVLEKTLNKHESAFSKDDKKEMMSKMIEKSMAKSLKSHENFDFPRMEDSDGMDMNFIYSKDLFSNFINFNLDDFDNVKQEEERQDIISPRNQNLFQELSGENLPNLHTDVKNKNNTDSKADYLHGLSGLKLSKIKKMNKNFLQDNRVEIELQPDVNRADVKKKFKELNSKMTKQYFNKLILEEEIDLFNSTISKFTGHLDTLRLQNITDTLTRDFVEDIEEEVHVKREFNEEQQSQNEKFRFDKQISTAKKRRSIDSSAILSNISISDVFESTDKKLLNKTSYMDSLTIPDNIILEEDSNLNLNTLSYNNMRSNFNNMELDFQQEDFNLLGSQGGDNSNLDLNYVNSRVDELLTEMRHKKKGRRSSVKNNQINLVQLAAQILPAESNSKLKQNELEAVIFYQMLISAQNHQYEFSQSAPFEPIYLI